MAGGVIVVFDFDKTLIDCDSDNWIIDHFSLNALFTQLLPISPWNSIMARMMMELHARGKSIEDIAECLKEAPLIHSSIVSAIKSAYSAGCEFRILSDANVFFIETILKHHDLLHCFSEINTNPSFVDDEGALRILPYFDFQSSSHHCSICPPNMCKGKIMERIMRTCEGKKVMYVGDGRADFCAGLTLKEGDIFMPRKNFPVWELMSTTPLSIKAHIHAWKDGEDLGSSLLSLITSIEESCNTGEAAIHHAPVLPVLSIPNNSTLSCHDSTNFHTACIRLE